jgi:hypothetical protein
MSFQTPITISEAVENVHSNRFLLLIAGSDADKYYF